MDPFSFCLWQLRLWGAKDQYLFACRSSPINDRKYSKSVSTRCSLFFAYVIWSQETVTYRCEGEGEGRYSQSFIDEYGKRENPYVAEIGFLKIESHSKLTLLYAEDRHTIWWERPDGFTELWTNIEDLGIQLQLKEPNGEVEGVFSTISGSLSLSTGREFKGLCQAVNS